jgi:hypothetical protein
MNNEVQIESVKNESSIKMQNLVLGLIFDAIGMSTYLFPGVAEFADVIWAPISRIIIMKMYKGNVGKVAGYISLFEELIPFTDAIPTFTLTWIYTYIIKKEK